MSDVETQRRSFDELEEVGTGFDFEGAPFSGVAFSVGSNGLIDEEATFVKGIQQGPFKSWSRKGKLVREGNVQNGAFHGTVTDWYSSGTKRKQAEYLYGIEISSKIWTRYGSLKEEKLLSPESDLWAYIRKREEISNSIAAHSLASTSEET